MYTSNHQSKNPFLHLVIHDNIVIYVYYHIQSKLQFTVKNILVDIWMAVHFLLAVLQIISLVITIHPFSTANLGQGLSKAKKPRPWSLPLSLFQLSWGDPEVLPSQMRHSACPKSAPEVWRGWNTSGLVRCLNQLNGCVQWLRSSLSLRVSYVLC